MLQPLPESLGPRFTTADARSAGVTRSRLRASDLGRPFHGVRSIRVGDVAEATSEFRLLERVHDYAVRMTEHEFFTHVAAAVIWGIPLPAHIVADRRPDVGVLAPRRNPAGAGVIGHSVGRGWAHIVEHPAHGVRVTSPASTWAMLAGVITHPYDLVAIADSILREPIHRTDPPALGLREQLDASLAAGRRVGIGRLREALPRASTRSASRPESWLRLLIVDAGFPEPAVNFDIVASGRWLGRVDLAYPEWRIAIEYEGEHHLMDPARWSADIARVDRLVEAGWRVIRVTKADVFGDPTPLLRRIRRAIALAS
jgi:hypothetical protein